MKYLTAILILGVLTANAQETTNSLDCVNVLLGKSNLTCNLSEIEKIDKDEAKVMAFSAAIMLGRVKPEQINKNKQLCFDSKSIFNCKGANEGKK